MRVRIPLPAACFEPEFGIRGSFQQTSAACSWTRRARDALHPWNDGRSARRLSSSPSRSVDHRRTGLTGWRRASPDLHAVPGDLGEAGAAGAVGTTLQMHPPLGPEEALHRGGWVGARRVAHETRAFGRDENYGCVGGEDLAGAGGLPGPHMAQLPRSAPSAWGALAASSAKVTSLRRAVRCGRIAGLESTAGAAWGQRLSVAFVTARSRA